MKYTLNDGYNGDVLVSQCGLIFKKELATEVPIKKSFEVERYIDQKYIIPFKEEVKELKEDIKAKEDAIKKANSGNEIPKSKGVSTQEVKEETFKPEDNVNIPLEKSEPETKVETLEKAEDNNSKE